MISQDSILIFGATGQLGKSLIKRFTQNNQKVIAVTRDIHKKGYILKTQGNYGWLELEEINSFSPEKIHSLMARCSICINLIGILYEKKKDDFKNIHTQLPSLLSKIAKEKNLKQFIHVSALGIDIAAEKNDSKYAISKVNGENEIKKNFKNYVILKPSIIFSVDDNFSTNFMKLLSWLPAMPLYYSGGTKFAPIHASDMAEIIFQVVKRNLKGETIQCVGPEELSFKDIILKLLNSIDKKRILIPLPLFIAKLSAKLFEKMPKPLLTQDQLSLLKYDSIANRNYKSNIDFGIQANKKFEEEIKKYSFNWKSGGQYTKNNFSKNN